MNSDAIVEKNNELRKQLSPENYKFYSDFMLYVRTQNLDRDENQLEAQLLNILEDTLDAQSDGVSAADYFGKNPKELGDELLQSLPQNFKDVFKLLLMGIASFIFFSLFPAFADPKTVFDLGALLMAASYFMVVILVGYKLVGQTIYNSWFMKMNKRVKFFILFGLFAILYVIGIVLQSVVTTPLKFTLSGWTGIVAILLIDLIALVLFIRSHYKDVFVPVVPLVTIFSVIGILIRIPNFGDYWLKKVGDSTLLVLTIALTVFITWLWSSKRSKRNKSNDKQGEKR